ncbi:MAG: hypothetical protein HQL14_04595 [Candidatus Omnitrophica bacterium]|nr:hypothetical protein [Candidatus Omnitrophota bacterium]
MIKLRAKLSFILFTLLTVSAFAGQNSITAPYPAPIGEYSQVLLTNQQTPATLCGTKNAANQFINAGAIFVDPATGQLVMCDNKGAMILYGEQCFNRFCSGNGCNPGCPAGYSQAPAVRSTSIIPVSPGYWVTSIVCCETGKYSFPT